MRSPVTRSSGRAGWAGYLQWYKTGVRFFCGAGDATIPVAGAYVDFAVWNRATSEVDLTVAMNGPPGPFVIEDRPLPADSYVLYWNLQLSGEEVSSFSVDASNDADTFWTVVFYPHPPASDRRPYTD